MNQRVFKIASLYVKSASLYVKSVANVATLMIIHDQMLIIHEWHDALLSCSCIVIPSILVQKIHCTTILP